MMVSTLQTVLLLLIRLLSQNQVSMSATLSIRFMKVPIQKIVPACIELIETYIFLDPHIKILIASQLQKY